MSKVKNVEEGVKFKLPSGEIFIVEKYIGKSRGGKSDLWKCRNNHNGEAVFTDWAILEKEAIN